MQVRTRVTTPWGLPVLGMMIRYAQAYFCLCFKPSIRLKQWQDGQSANQIYQKQLPDQNPLIFIKLLNRNIYITLTVNNINEGGLNGYSEGSWILPWYIPPSNSVSVGPLIANCHSKIFSYKFYNKQANISKLSLSLINEKKPNTALTLFSYKKFITNTHEMHK